MTPALHHASPQKLHAVNHTAGDLQLTQQSRRHSVKSQGREWGGDEEDSQGKQGYHTAAKQLN